MLTLSLRTPALVLITLLFSGCALFSSHYDATRHQNFTSLKAMHMKLLDDWTKGSGKTWSHQKVDNYCESGDLRFREALAYAESGDSDDQTASQAVTILWKRFTSNCEFLLSRDKPFSKAFIGELRPEIEQNYDYAISGELARVKD